jgi:hypothetical protein
MSLLYRHKRYFRVRLASDNSLYVFTNENDANNKIEFNPAFTTNAPKKIEVLENSNRTFIVTYEFNSHDEQMEFKSAIGAACDRGGQFGGTNNLYKVEHFKTEWLHADGTVGSTANLL